VGLELATLLTKSVVCFRNIHWQEHCEHGTPVVHPISTAFIAPARGLAHKSLRTQDLQMHRQESHSKRKRGETGEKSSSSSG
jgi:hypothetical protein